MRLFNTDFLRGRASGDRMDNTREMALSTAQFIFSAQERVFTYGVEG
jgi:hypothetical protein